MSDCGCDSCHVTEEKEKDIRPFLARLATALILIAVLAFADVPFYANVIVHVFAYFLAGFEVVRSAAVNITRGRIFDENFLICVATAAAFSIGDYTEAVAVMIFFGIGELLQGMAVARSKKHIRELMDIRPDSATMKNGEKADPKDVRKGDIIVVRPGERIPLDGVVTKGTSFVDTKAITGESLPRSVGEGDEVLSGTVNRDGVLEIKVQKEFGESTVAKILELVENAADKKSRSEKFITRFAKIYTPAVVLAAVAVAVLPPLLNFGGWDEWIYRAITFLIVSCPCALVISIPVSVFAGIGGAARNGIMIKGGNHLETLNDITTVAFDKTGTLTEGVFEVGDIVTEGISATELLELAAIAEQHSTHPIAVSVLSHYGRAVEREAVIRELSGHGTIAEFDDVTVHAGNRKLMESIGIAELPVFPQTAVYIALNGRYAGCILISDRIRRTAERGIAELRSVNITRTIMLTGDSEVIASNVASELGVDEYRADLLPQDKVAEFERIKERYGKTMFVGDGINDAPVLALADLGMAMGGIGSDAAIESADIVLMDDDIGKIATAKRAANKTRKIIRQNIVLALGIKAGVMVLAFLGLTSLWMAVFADVGVALLAVLNAARCLRVPPSPYPRTRGPEDGTHTV
ncbi:MAG: cadmium-translocating P-type ATPase [Methanomassiliicoccaceae archaeon]|nr:cadmium-translocating P-type ATPase [Methanomassiliicoccaceae archaeon]